MDYFTPDVFLQVKGEIPCEGGATPCSDPAARKPANSLIQQESEIQVCYNNITKKKKKSNFSQKCWSSSFQN